jgi:putative hemolysin
VLKAMEIFRKKRMHYAFVIDEYGTLEGFITMTDVAEAVAGDMPEDHESDEFNFQKLTPDSILINGSLTVQEMLETIGPVDLPEGDYNTVAGVALNVLKKFPQKGDSFELDGWTVSIEEMDGRRISRVLFTRNNRSQYSI